MAHGRNQRYRYYMCWSRDRYGSKEGCAIHRFNADELEAAVGQALLDFYTTGLDVIGEATAAFLADHAKATSNHHDELATIQRELKDNAAAVDRYLTAFEKGTLDDEDPEVQARLTKLKSQSKQLRSRKAEIEYDLEQPPIPLAGPDIAKIRAEIAEILTHGNHRARKALFEALIDEIEIQSVASVIPRFRIPTHSTDQGSALGAPTLDQKLAGDTVRVLPHPVEPRGLEPLTSTLPERVSAYRLTWQPVHLREPVRSPRQRPWFPAWCHCVWHGLGTVVRRPDATCGRPLLRPVPLVSLTCPRAGPPFQPRFVAPSC